MSTRGDMKSGQIRSGLAVCLGLVVWMTSFPSPSVEARRLHLEKEYQSVWCLAQGGKMEVTQADKTRVDCLTDTHAIEFDFGAKWAEAIGQSLYYAIQTGKEPGVVLILEKDEDSRYWKRLNKTIDQRNLNIKTWQMRPEDL